MQIYPLTITKSRLGACVKNLPWPPGYIQDGLCCKRVFCDLFPYTSILWTVCLPNSDQQQEKKVFWARGSHLVMAVTSSQVKGNRFHPCWGILALFLDFSRTVTGGDKAGISWSCTGTARPFSAEIPHLLLAEQGGRAQVPPGAASSRLRFLHGNVSSRAVWLGAAHRNPARLREAARAQLSHSGVCQPHRDAPGHPTDLMGFVCNSDLGLFSMGV